MTTILDIDWNNPSNNEGTNIDLCVFEFLIKGFNFDCLKKNVKIKALWEWKIFEVSFNFFSFLNFSHFEIEIIETILNVHYTKDLSQNDFSSIQ